MTEAHANEALAQKGGKLNLVAPPDPLKERQSQHTQNADPVPFGAIVLGSNSRLNYKKLEELAAGIGANGLIVPIIVQPIFDEKQKLTDKFKLIAGFRRYKAIQLLRNEALSRKEKPPFDVVPCQYYDGSPLDAIFTNLEENFGRADLTTYELGLNFRMLRDEHKLKPADISIRIGYSTSHVNNCLGVVEKLHSEIKKYLEAGHEIGQQFLFDWKALSDEEQLKEFNKWRNHKTPETTSETGSGSEDRESPQNKMLPPKKAAVFLRALLAEARDKPTERLQFGVQVARYLMQKTSKPPIKVPTEAARKTRRSSQD